MPFFHSRHGAALALYPLVTLLLLTGAACADNRGVAAASTSEAGSTGSSAPTTVKSPNPADPAPTDPTDPATGTCGRSGPPPATYQHVVVFVNENRTWDEVGGVGFGDLPWMGRLAAGCSVYTDWRETNPDQNSLTQYIGLTSGVDNPATVNDCKPSQRCRSTDDNIFRQVRESGGTARTYVEGATKPCSAKGNAPKHIPALYYQGGDDPAHCADEVRPLTELDPDNLPTYTMVVPDLCHDGHNCGDGTVDSWLADHLGPVLDGADYQAGTTAVFVLWDEDRPVPNLLIAPTAAAGPLSLDGAGHAAALRTMEEMLDLPLLGGAADGPSLRPSANL